MVPLPRVSLNQNQGVACNVIDLKLRDSFQVHSLYWQNLVPCTCMCEVPISLVDASLGLLSASRSLLKVKSCGLYFSKLPRKPPQFLILFIWSLLQCNHSIKSWECYPVSLSCTVNLIKGKTLPSYL